MKKRKYNENSINLKQYVINLCVVSLLCLKNELVFNSLNGEAYSMAEIIYQIFSK